ncbi:MAG: hypothetical protein P4M11_03485 [Candidatus Pacebacteria bacterium]|nr:hypothetical protein [Candidatus Paceibacterota bacterium]
MKAENPAVGKEYVPIPVPVQMPLPMPMQIAIPSFPMMYPGLCQSALAALSFRGMMGGPGMSFPGLFFGGGVGSTSATKYTQ